MNYNIKEHRHRFATWAAARAVQRGFTKTINIIDAIDSTNLREIAMSKSLWPKTSSDFEKLHKVLCRKIITKLETTYGRAAKIVAIYLKTAVVLSGNENSEFAKILHPPIDRILLCALKKKLSSIWIQPKLVNWTELTESGEKSYFKLVGELRTINKHKPFWQIEEIWKPK